MFSMYERLMKFISEHLTSSKRVNDEHAWVELLKRMIDERFNVAKVLLEHRVGRVRDVIATRRLDEIEQHRDHLERHLKVTIIFDDSGDYCQNYFQDVQEKVDSLNLETDRMCKEAETQTNSLHNNVQLVRRDVDEYSLSELTELVKRLRDQMNSVAVEQNNAYKMHRDKLESQYRAMADSTLEFMKSIK